MISLFLSKLTITDFTNNDFIDTILKKKKKKKKKRTKQNRKKT